MAAIRLSSSIRFRREPQEKIGHYHHDASRGGEHSSSSIMPEKNAGVQLFSPRHFTPAIATKRLHQSKFARPVRVNDPWSPNGARRYRLLKYRRLLKYHQVLP